MRMRSNPVSHVFLQCTSRTVRAIASPSIISGKENPLSVVFGFMKLWRGPKEPIACTQNRSKLSIELSLIAHYTNHSLLFRGTA